MPLFVAIGSPSGPRQAVGPEFTDIAFPCGNSVRLTAAENNDGVARLQNVGQSGELGRARPRSLPGLPNHAPCLAAIHVEVQSECEGDSYELYALLEPQEVGAPRSVLVVRSCMQCAFCRPDGSSPAMQAIPVGANTRFFLAGKQGTTVRYLLFGAGGSLPSVAPAAATPGPPGGQPGGTGEAGAGTRKRARPDSPVSPRSEAGPRRSGLQAVAAPAACDAAASVAADPLDSVPDSPMHLMRVRYGVPRCALGLCEYPAGIRRGSSWACAPTRRAFLLCSAEAGPTKGSLGSRCATWFGATSAGRSCPISSWTCPGCCQPARTSPACSDWCLCTASGRKAQSKFGPPPSGRACRAHGAMNACACLAAVAWPPPKRCKKRGWRSAPSCTCPRCPSLARTTGQGGGCLGCLAPRLGCGRVHLWSLAGSRLCLWSWPAPTPTPPRFQSRPGPSRSKAFLLEYERGLRVVIFSANAIFPDCNNKSEGGRSIRPRRWLCRRAVALRLAPADSPASQPCLTAGHAGLFWQDFPRKDAQSPDVRPRLQHPCCSHIHWPQRPSPCALHAPP